MKTKMMQIVGVVFFTAVFGSVSLRAMEPPTPSRDEIADCITEIAAQIEPVPGVVNTWPYDSNALVFGTKEPTQEYPTVEMVSQNYSVDPKEMRDNPLYLSDLVYSQPRKVHGFYQVTEKAHVVESDFQIFGGSKERLHFNSISRTPTQLEIVEVLDAKKISVKDVNTQKKYEISADLAAYIFNGQLHEGRTANTFAFVDHGGRIRVAKPWDLDSFDLSIDESMRRDARPWAIDVKGLKTW